MKLRLAALDELNARPLWFTLADDPEVELRRETRMGATRLLEEDRVDLGIVSVVKAAEAGWYRVPGIGIAAAGKLDSVFMLSNGRPQDATVVYAARESRTSVMLMQALLRRIRRIPAIVTVSAEEARDRTLAEPNAAALIIGDDAIKQRGHFSEAWDLPQAWNEVTGLPMVFGVWASRTRVSDAVQRRMSDAAAAGQRRHTEIAALAATSGLIDRNGAETYLGRLHYTLGIDDEAGIALLLTLLHEYELIRLPPGAPTLAADHPDIRRWMHS